MNQIKARSCFHFWSSLKNSHSFIYKAPPAGEAPVEVPLRGQKAEKAQEKPLEGKVEVKELNQEKLVGALYNLFNPLFKDEPGKNRELNNISRRVIEHLLKNTPPDRLKTLYQKTASIELKEGAIRFNDEIGKELDHWYVGEILKDYFKEKQEAGKEKAAKQSEQGRREVAGGYGPEVDRARAAAGKGPEEILAILTNPHAPGDPKAEKHVRETLKVFRAKKGRREKIIREMIEDHKEDRVFGARVSPRLQSQAGFEKHWPFMEGRKQIEALFQEESADTGGHYGYNPFVEKNWTSRDLQELITDKASDGMLTFKHVTDMLWKKPFKEFKKQLEEQKVSKQVIGMLDSDIFDALEKFQKLDQQLDQYVDAYEVPGTLQDLYAHKAEIHAMRQRLEDYVAYAGRLISLMNRVKYNPAKEDEYRANTPFEMEIDENGKEVAHDENRARQMLYALYDPPKKLAPNYGLTANDPEERFILPYANGKVAVLQGKFFEDRRDWRADYVHSFRKGEKIVDGERKFDLTPVINGENDKIQIGIRAYATLKSERPLKDIINELGFEGAGNLKGERLRCTHEPPTAQEMNSLYEALFIERPEDLHAQDHLDRLINAARSEFASVGSVVLRNMKAQEQREKILEGALQNFRIKLSDTQIAEILIVLERQGVPKEHLPKIKSAFQLGIGIVVPTGENMPGGVAIAGRIPIGEDGFLDIGGMVLIGQGMVMPGIGAAIGGSVKVEKLTLSGTVGMGVSPVGVTAGVGGRIAYTFDEIDVYLEGGIGAGTGGLSGFVGLGVRENAEAVVFHNLAAKREKLGIPYLEQTKDPYAEVKSHPELYPEFYELIKVSRQMHFDAASERRFFTSMYAAKKGEVEKMALTETAPAEGKPLGVGAGVMGFLNGAVWMPYVYVEFAAGSKILVTRTATSEKELAEFNEAEINAAILKDVEKKTGKKAEMAEGAPLMMSSRVILNPENGRLMLEKTSEINVDFASLEGLQALREEAAKHNILITPADRGLLKIEFVGAHGPSEAWIDQALGRNGILVQRGGELFISLKQGQKLSIKRRDRSYPFEQFERSKRKVTTEETVVTLSGDKFATLEDIKRSSAFYMFRYPTKEWQRLEYRPEEETKAEHEAKMGKQANIMENPEYREWWKEVGKGLGDRLAPGDPKQLKKEYEAFVASFTLREIPGKGVTPEFLKRVDALAKDRKVLEQFRKLSTEGVDYGKIKANWELNYPRLAQLLNEKLGKDGAMLSPLELRAAMTRLTILSFQNIHGKTKEETIQKFHRNMDNFEKKILTALFLRHYKDDPEKERKTREAVEWTLNNFKDASIIMQQGEPVPPGAVFASTVGMGGITGERVIVDYDGTADKWGVVGKRTLDPTAKGPEGEVAEYWLRTLSLQALADKGIQHQGDYEKIQGKLFDKMHTRTAVKLAPVLALAMTPEEWAAIKAINENADKKGLTTSGLINERNIGAVQKFLDLVDKVHEAEAAGKNTVALPNGRTLHIAPSLSLGLFKLCSNVTAIKDEAFGISFPGKSQIYSVASSEAVGATDVEYQRRDSSWLIGIGFPVKKEGPPIRPPRTPPPPRAAKENPTVAGRTDAPGTPTGTDIKEPI